MTHENLMDMTAHIVAAHVGNNTVAISDVPQLIALTYGALRTVDMPRQPPTLEFIPAVSARASLKSPDAIISMIDGKPYKMLKRHLANHGLTPDEYRRRYELPADYPMTAKGYSEKRRALAIHHGLGLKVAQ
jgi:predicted transcriptional regulator